jgi:importin subunit alpha-6/7
MPFILETGCLPRLAQLMMHNNVAITIPVLRSIGNIVTGDDLNTQMAINSGILLNLNELI